jgi:hypothetical protein
VHAGWINTISLFVLPGSMGKSSYRSVLRHRL